MMLLADMEDMGLCVLPTHRLVKNVKGFEPSKSTLVCSQLL